MVDRVLPWAGRYSEPMIRKTVSDVVADIVGRPRLWSGLLANGILKIPAVYSTGRVAVAAGSATVTGTATAWPVDDVLDVAIYDPVIQTGYATVLVGDNWTLFKEGQWVTVNAGQADEECVCVTDVTENYITAKFTKTHAASAAATTSSLAGRQFRISNNYPMYTVVGVSSATSLTLDAEWMSASLSSQTYSIGAVYVSFGNDVKMLVSVVNPAQQYQLALHLPKSYLDYRDPRRSTTGQPEMAVFHGPDPAGIPLYEIYPRPTSATAMPYLYMKQWSRMEEDSDLLPNGIRSDVVINRVIAEALVFPENKDYEGGKFYDPQVSRQKLEQFERQVAQMSVDDDNTSMTSLMFRYRDLPFVGFGAEWNQSHDLDMWQGNC